MAKDKCNYFAIPGLKAGAKKRTFTIHQDQHIARKNPSMN